ncbi:MAG TPA: hopanoid biosynthesis-associated protein HpnK [Steroidobacteraceae bacterium]|nr:hopanoid biosynthesis-associated protein HpnK [Steroidobacteraceae bacterium]
MRKFLILTADDFGLHEAINEAVEQASVAGVLTSASLMVGAPASPDAVRRARALPGLRVGLHIVLADGWSVLPHRQIPALVDREGRFPDRMLVEGLRYFTLRRARRQLEAEIRAQFEAFAATGLPLDHVNAHKHFHLHPTLLGMILRIGREFGLNAMRVPREPRAAAPHGALAASASAMLMGPWLMWMRRRLRAMGVAHNDQVFGIAASGSLDEPVLLRILAKLPPGTTEIYFHPAVRTAAPITASMSQYRHADEFAALLSSRVREAITATGAACGGYGDMLRARAQRAH